MEAVVEGIPNSLHGDLSKKLIDIVLSTQDKNAVPAELAKKIIYLWRQEQIASLTGILSLLEASVMVDAEATYSVLDELGLQETTSVLKTLQ
ncbi:MAG: hypothetical protein V3S97_06005 [Candidatus Bathyarchaeia archaeon]